jgi:dipeptidase
MGYRANPAPQTRRNRKNGAQSDRLYTARPSVPGRTGKNKRDGGLVSASRQPKRSVETAPQAYFGPIGINHNYHAHRLQLLKESPQKAAHALYNG